jgi:glucose-6-phosphate dehydrogenase-like protein OpcA
LSTAELAEWTGEDVTVDDVERQLAMLRGGGHEVELRTSVMTHIAWVPPEWVAVAREAFAGLGERYPSRTILLLPEPERPDGLDAVVALQCFPVSGSDHVCTEVVELELRGIRSEAPASIVAPLLLPDLPVFLRWRGQPPFGEAIFERLAGLVDRLVVDSREWPDLPHAYGPLAEHFSAELAVSDIVWARTLPWRASCAFQWPAIGSVEELRVVGPLADALLLVGWLRSRLKRAIALRHEPAAEIEAVEADGKPVSAPEEPPPTPGELLSAELDRFGRDRIYEDAVRAALAEDAAGS